MLYKQIEHLATEQIRNLILLAMTLMNMQNRLSLKCSQEFIRIKSNQAWWWFIEVPVFSANVASLWFGFGPMVHHITVLLESDFPKTFEFNNFVLNLYCSLNHL